MKTKRGKIYCCLILIGAIVVSIGITASFAYTKPALTDAEMSSVYGGCGPCDWDGQGCAGGSSTHCNDRNPCTGNYRQSCRQDEKECQNQSGPCTPQSKSCSGKQYSVYHCIEAAGDCVTQDYYGPLDCSGSMDWCEGEE